MKNAANKLEDEVNSQKRKKPTEYAPVRLISGKSTQYRNSKGSITEKKQPVAIPAIKNDSHNTVAILCTTDIDPIRAKASMIFINCLDYKYMLKEYVL